MSVHFPSATQRGALPFARLRGAERGATLLGITPTPPQVSPGSEMASGQPTGDCIRFPAGKGCSRRESEVTFKLAFRGVRQTMCGSITHTVLDL